MTIEKTEHRVDVEPGVSLFVGEKSIAAAHGGALFGKAALCLPGAGSDHRGFDCPVRDYSLLDLLARHGCRAFGVDFRGFGRSPKPVDGKTVTAGLCTADTIKVIGRIRQITGCERVSLLGASFGSIVATLVAEAAPEMVDQLVLFGFIYARVNPRNEQAITPEAWQAVDMAPSGYMPPKPELKRASLPCAEADILDWTLDVSSYDIPTGPLQSVRALPLVKDPASITAPVLVINGAHEIFASEADSRAFLERVSSPAKALHTLPNAGHAPFMERDYRRVHQLVVDFLQTT